MVMDSIFSNLQTPIVPWATWIKSGEVRDYSMDGADSQQYKVFNDTWY